MLRSPVTLSISFSTILFFLQCTPQSVTPAEDTRSNSPFTDMEVTTSIFAAVDQNSQPLVDGDTMYYQMSIKDPVTFEYSTRIIRLNLTTGDTNVLNFKFPSTLFCFEQDDNYLYFCLWLDKSVYRVPKTGIGSMETVAGFEGTLQQMNVAGNELFIIFRDTPGLFRYTIADGTLTQLLENHWPPFTIVDNSIFYITADIADHDGYPSIWQMSRETGASYERIQNGSLLVMNGDYIYYNRSEDTALMRFNVHNHEPSVLVSSTYKHIADKGLSYTILDDAIFLSNNDGELRGLPFGTTSDSAVVIDTWGRFDDDDVNSWIGTNGTALFWIAGPDSGNHNNYVSVVLLKTVFSLK